MTSKPYTGILKRRLPSPMVEASLMTRKVWALFVHYGVSLPESEPQGELATSRALEEGWRTLAIKLALAHVPGFQEGRNAGAPRRWGLGAQLQLLEHMKAAMDEGRNVAKAVRHLTRKTGPYPGERSLRRRFEEAKNNPAAAELLELMERRPSLSNEAFEREGMRIIHGAMREN